MPIYNGDDDEDEDDDDSDGDDNEEPSSPRKQEHTTSSIDMNSVKLELKSSQVTSKSAPASFINNVSPTPPVDFAMYLSAPSIPLVTHIHTSNHPPSLGTSYLVYLCSSGLHSPSF